MLTSITQARALEESDENGRDTTIFSADLSLVHFWRLPHPQQVVEELRRELPQLENFVTLSPVPGFMKWLSSEAQALPQEDRDIAAALANPAWAGEPTRPEALRKGVENLAAEYFLHAKGANGRPRDPVARFHLGNGARLERINPMGDLSRKGIAQAAGLMVNYRYVLADIEKNHEAYAGKGEVVASAPVKKLLRSEASARSLVPVQ
jgi:malonyl-CoA decarboxylase